MERTPRHAKIIEKAFSSNRLLSKHITRIFDNILPEINFVITKLTKEKKKMYNPHVTATANKILSCYYAYPINYGTCNKYAFILILRCTCQTA